MKIQSLFIPLIVFALLAVGVFLALGQPIGAMGLTQLPDEARIFITTLVTSGLTILLVWLGSLIKFDFAGWIQPLAAVLAPMLIALVENYLGMIPSVFDDLVLTIIHLILLLVGSIGTILVYLGFKKKSKAPQADLLLEG